jgi:hypothetical protein
LRDLNYRDGHSSSRDFRLRSNRRSIFRGQEHLRGDSKAPRLLPAPRQCATPPLNAHDAAQSDGFTLLQ